MLVHRKNYRPFPESSRFFVDSLHAEREAGIPGIDTFPRRCCSFAFYAAISRRARHGSAVVCNEMAGLILTVVSSSRAVLERLIRLRADLSVFQVFLCPFNFLAN